MLHGQQYDWIVLRFPKFLFHVTDRVAEIGNTVSQPVFELIGWNDNHTSIDVTILEIVTYMNDIPSKKIASARDLNLDAQS